MSLSLQILNGDRYGETLVLEKSSSLGRQADVSIEDPKMSKTHVVFELDKMLGWFIRDQGSKNGMIINGARSESHLLSEGDMIEIGLTQLRVASVSAFWKPTLNQVLIDALDGVKNAPMAAYLFRTIPVLNFIQGLQAGKSLVLEYGPRQAGGESEDIILFEPRCPDQAFEISASGQGIQFKTDYPQIVQLNQQEVKKKLLKKGDQIHIHNTIIEIDFLNL